MMHNFRLQQLFSAEGAQAATVTEHVSTLLAHAETDAKPPDATGVGLPANQLASADQVAAGDGIAVKDEVDAKPEAAEDDEETYERDATELLGHFKSQEEETPAQTEDAEALMKQFMLDMKDVDRENEVNRMLWAFKLNPFEKLDLRFTATAAEVKTAYRCV